MNMVEAKIQPSFDSWRDSARRALRAGIKPERLIWTDSDAALPGLATPLERMIGASESAPRWAPHKAEHTFSVPRALVELAKAVCLHRDAGRWSLLYGLLYRIVNEQPRLLEIATDEDVHRAREMEKKVRTDLHKMHAFVRFRKTTDESGEHYIAFHRPDHLILTEAAPWFARRFPTMRWTIITPDGSADWDGREIRFGPGASASPVDGDALEDLWRTYYRSIFNPARIKIDAMKKEMPLRHWPTLPETQEIGNLLHAAPNRVEKMIRATPVRPAESTAAAFVPQTTELAVLRQSASHCQGCDLHCHATQTVFGEGPADAVAVFVGEQPGDQEDLAGRPFVGPAGQLLNECLAQVGIAREVFYITNAVKHFKFEPRGKRRIHAKPNAREIHACRPWLEAEIGLIRPQMIVALGATAAQSMLGPQFRLTPNRGRVFTDSPWAPWWMATLHPSALLRIPDPRLQAEARAHFLDDLRLAARQIADATR